MPTISLYVNDKTYGALAARTPVRGESPGQVANYVLAKVFDDKSRISARVRGLLDV